MGLLVIAALAGHRDLNVTRRYVQLADHATTDAIAATFDRDPRRGLA